MAKNDGKSYRPARPQTSVDLTRYRLRYRVELLTGMHPSFLNRAFGDSIAYLAFIAVELIAGKMSVEEFDRAYLRPSLFNETIQGLIVDSLTDSLREWGEDIDPLPKFAELAGEPSDQILLIIRGGKPTAAQISALSTVLQRPVEELMELTDNQYSSNTRPQENQENGDAHPANCNNH